MTLHCETPLVKTFGNSVFFADHLGMLPTMFQPFLFYPDWLFMTWPLQAFFALTGNGCHPYFNGIGPEVLGWSIVWYVVGVIAGFFNASDTFTDFIQTERPLFIRIPINFIAYLLFWHIVIGRILGVFLTRFTTANYELTLFIRRAVMTLMIIPPILGLLFSLFVLIVH